MAEKTYVLNTDQLSALHALLSLVHYDDLASEWINLLPFDFNPAIVPLIHPTYDALMSAPVLPPVSQTS